jgi:hypothetical protein
MSTAFERRVKKLRDHVLSTSELKIEEAKEELQQEETEIDKTGKEPTRLGGGWYELPNGEKIKGKEEALKAMGGE